jgi:acetyltransferase-like isoleucine patch superfamily enzyme
MNKFPAHKEALIFLMFVISYGLGCIPLGLIFYYVLLPVGLSGNLLYIILLFLSAPLVFTIWIVSEIFSTAFIAWAFRLKTKEGVYEVNLRNKDFFKWTLFQACYQPLASLLYYMQEATFKMLHMSLFGAKFGKNVHWNLYVPDPHLLEVGDNVVTGAIGEVLTHSGITDKLIVKKVRVGNNCSIGENTIILPGAVLEEGAIVGASSLVPKNKVLRKGVWAGVPVKKIK